MIRKGLFEHLSCSNFCLPVHAKSFIIGGFGSPCTGARVILACRDVEKGERAAADIRREVDGANAVFRQLDLADTKSICLFAESIYSSRSHLTFIF